MRILILSDGYPPASVGSYQTQCFQATQGLAARGHAVRVLTSRTESKEHRGEPAHVVFRQLSPYPERTPVASRFFTLYRLNKANADAFRRHIEEFHPEAIMIWAMGGLPFSLLLQAEHSGVPCVYVVYDHWLGSAADRDPWFNYWNRDDVSEPAVLRGILQKMRMAGKIRSRAPFGRIADLRFEHICFCSESLKAETIRRSRLPLDHAEIIPCSIQTSEIRRRTGQPVSPRRLLYVARLNDEKDPLTAVKAVVELRRRGYEQFTLDIFGRGDVSYEGMLHEYVRRFQLGGSISFKPMNDELVRNNIHLYDMLIFTSKYPEPFPLIHLKAMAARVPVVTTLEGGAAELIRDGENGIAFRTGDEKDLADKILALGQDFEGRKAIAEAGYNEATGRFSAGQSIPKFESLLRRAATERPRSRVVA